MDTVPTPEMQRKSQRKAPLAVSAALPWQVQLLSGLKAACGERALEKFQTQKTAALLSYLAFYCPRRFPREELIDLLWPEADQDAGRNRLSQTLSWLRLHLEPEQGRRGTVLWANRQEVGLIPQTIHTDVSEFVAAANAGGADAPMHPPAAAQVAALERAAALYTGSLLPGHYEDWVLTERQRLLTLFLSVLHQLILHHEQAQHWERALDYARRGVAVDPISEEMHRTLIRGLAASGQPEAALRQFRDLKQILHRELGVMPSAATLALAEQVRQDARNAARKAAFVRTSSPVLSALVMPLTRFFGREAEIASLRKVLLRDTVRLVTLTGIGGTGKTRLALEAAGGLTEDFAGAVWFVPLADITDPASLPAALLDALQITPSTEASALKQVCEALSRRPALLVLDNLEHLMEGAGSLVRELLEQTTTLKILATSRQCLSLHGEQEIPLLPLAPPEWEEENTPDKNSRLQRLMQIESVRLFVDRVRLVRPAFDVTPQNAEAIARICIRLEGLPLAIELCASWAQTLTPAQMLDQLSRRFEFLVSRRRDIAPRHRSLRAALEYSYLLLPLPLQQFFVQLSVFRGGWTAQAAETVCLSHLSGSRTAATLTSLAELRERSLLTAEEHPAGGSEMRYRMLEALREFAAEQWSLLEDAALRRHHAEYFVALAEKANPHLTGFQQKVWLARLEAEYDNLRAALSWTVESHSAELGLQMVVALSRFWEIRGYFREAQQWLERLLLLTSRTASASENLRLRAQALTVYANVFEGLTDYLSAGAYAAQALALWRELEDEDGIAFTLTILGSISIVHDDFTLAMQFIQEARTVSHRVGNKRISAFAANCLGRINLTQEDWSGAAEAFSESLDLYRVLADWNKAAVALNNLGLVARYRGDLTAARDLLRQALSEQQILGARPGMAISLLNLATVDRLDQCYTESMSAVRQAALLAQEIDDQRVQAWCIKEFGHLLCALGSWKVGIALLCASESLRQTLGTSFLPADPAELSRDVLLGQSALGEAAFAEAWQSGEQWTAQEAFIQAVQTVDETGSGFAAEYII